MWSTLGLELLRAKNVVLTDERMFQCPLGLIPHFYEQCYFFIYRHHSIVSMPSRAYTSFLQGRCNKKNLDRRLCFNALSGLYLISTIMKSVVAGEASNCFNALSGLYLISTVPLQKPRFYAVSRACFCRYLSEYSDNSCFSCMLTFWTYLMRCTYP